MKKLIYIGCCLLGLLAFSSCEKEMDDYQGQDGLYFDVQYTDTPHYTNPEMWAHQLYTWVRFFSMPEGTNETQLSLKVNVVGEACDYDREFDVAVVVDGYLDGIYLVGAFVVGQDGFRGEFGFFGNPGHFAGVGVPLCIAKVGKYRDLVS